MPETTAPTAQNVPLGGQPVHKAASNKQTRENIAADSKTVIALCEELLVKFAAIEKQIPDTKTGPAHTIDNKMKVWSEDLRHCIAKLQRESA